MADLEPADGVLLISLERQRHPAKGYGPEHDLQHTPEELVERAVDYLSNAVSIGELAKAGSLIAAAIDRIIAEESQR